MVSNTSCTEHMGTRVFMLMQIDVHVSAVSDEYVTVYTAERLVILILAVLCFSGQFVWGRRWSP